MSSVPNNSRDGVWRLADACGQLLHPRVTAPEERQRQRRFLEVALAGPFLLAAALAQTLSAALGVSTALAAACVVIVCGWTAAVVVAQTGRRAVAELAVLAAAAAPVAAVVHFAGGASSPLALAGVALIVEAAYVGRTRPAVLAGCAAVAVAVAVSFLLSRVEAAAPAGVSAAHWIVPALYGATLWARRSAFAERLAAEPAAEAIDLEAVVDAVVLRFAGSGEVADVSARVEERLGVAGDFLLGDGLFQRVHVADRVAYLSALADMREGADRRSVELRLRLPDLDGGRAAHVHSPFVLEFGRDRRIAGGFAGLLRDNSRIVELRRQLAAGEAGRQAGQTRFLAAVSHEMRTPLNAVIGFSDMLLHDMAGPLANARQREYLGLVREAGQHLLSVVGSILDISRIEAGTYELRRETMSFERALTTSTAMVACQARAKSIELCDETAGEIGDIVADRTALQQVLINLLSNAVKFTPEGGRVAVGARLDGDGLTMWVADNGIGIAERDLPRLGEPFFQSLNDHTRHFEGTGLGLALVKGLVACQGGSMTIESAPGMGTKVAIVLPVGERGWRAAAGAGVIGFPSVTNAREQTDETLKKSA